MKFISIFFYSFFSVSVLFSQYSISGYVVMPYSQDSLIPLSNMKIFLMDKESIAFTDKNGYFNFNNLEKGCYSIKINIPESNFNKLIISDILVEKNIYLDTIQIIEDYSNPNWISLTRAFTIAGLKFIYKENGQFVLDTLTNNFYEHGLYREGQTITNPSDSVGRLYRQGIWKNDHYILTYDHGMLNGDFLVLDSTRQNITCKGYYKNNKRNGLWIFYDTSESELIRINFIDNYIIINQTDFKLKDYSSNIWRINNI